MSSFFSELGINVSGLLAQLISFLLLLGLLALVAYKPILKMFDERANKVKESLEQAEEIKKQSAQAEVALKKQMEQAAQESQEVINRALRTAEEERQAAQQQAKSEAEALLNRARSEIEHERDEAVNSVRREFADLTITAASKVIERSLDKKAHEEIINKVLKESKTLKKG